MYTITFANHKGGVGKTTSNLNVGQTLARTGKKVLLIDCDAQCNLTMSFPYNGEAQAHVGQVLQGEKTLAEVMRTVESNLWLVNATPHLHYLEKLIATQLGYEMLLREALEPLADQFDFCLLDTPPSLSALTYAALVASQAVFIPSQPEYYGFEGLTTLLDACARVRKHFNPNLKVGGVFFTKYSPTYRRKLHHDIVRLMKEDAVLGQLVMQTTIRENVALAEAQIQKESIHSWAPDSNGATDYENLTAEILTRL
ncbi:ParA family protein (plasmid) [Hymenobacter sp. NBH84]|uniref:ParA family protein n=1 Tax=Hymenobacter sp. NBH84 TaxID=2596915 RepID=UPI0016265475|nr:ParA family protein [Hymenobacter sp. NBH84]QNE42387.1 ParA family protein [Hymenobacter sp. NBH84]